MALALPVPLLIFFCFPTKESENKLLTPFFLQKEKVILDSFSSARKKVRNLFPFLDVCKKGIKIFKIAFAKKRIDLLSS